MQLHALHLTLTEADLAAVIAKGLEQTPQISDPQISFQDGLAIFKGKYKAGPLPIPFQAHCQLTAGADGSTLNIRLSKVQAAFFSGGGEMILKALAQQMPPTPGVMIEGDTLSLNIVQLAQARGAALSGRIKEIKLAPGTLTLNFG